jgi:hypothetical protein
VTCLALRAICEPFLFEKQALHSITGAMLLERLIRFFGTSAVRKEYTLRMITKNQRNKGIRGLLLPYTINLLVAEVAKEEGSYMLHQCGRRRLLLEDDALCGVLQIIPNIQTKKF